MKTKIILIISGLFFIFFLLLVSASLEINSSNYSGFFTQGSSSGNITDNIYSGDSASFYQQGIGYLNDLLFSGIHGFSFAAAEFTGFVPTLSIVNPQNKTYITTMNLPLNFTTNNQIYTWYNLDNGANITIAGNTFFNTTNGLHTLYLFANNTYGNSSRNVTFTVNASKFTIHYTNYSVSTRGSSTDFNQSTYEELQNLSRIVLENTNYGKISFNQTINMTNDSVPNDSILDLDSNTNISSNYININSTALSNLNISATLSLYNLTFTNPRILRDGYVCPPTICTEVSYSGGTLIFNVTQFSAYSAEETSAETPAGNQPSISGGGVSTATVEFTLDKNQISVSLNPGQVKTENITITNTGKDVISVKIDNTIPDFVIRSTAIVVLEPGESKVVPLYVLARVNTIPNLYLGKIIISSGTTKKEVLMAIEVQSAGALLDVRAEIDKSTKKVLAGTEIISEIRLFNLGGEGRKDIFIEYSVRDYEGNEILKETESLAIETQLDFLKKIEIPPDTKIGKYILYVRATYNDKISSSSDNFEVIKVIPLITTLKEKGFIVVVIILVVIIIILLLDYRIKKRKIGGIRRKLREKIKKAIRLLNKIMKSR